MFGDEPDDPGAPSAPAGTSSWFRPKGNLTKAELTFLLTVAIVPLIVVIVRVLALPDVLSPALRGSWFSSLGGELNHMLSLQDVPSGDRSSVLYMLFLPTSALLIALARLTFGIRVIGFRAILISVGFQESGIVPSLILIVVVVAIVMLVRPALRRIRLPHVARLSVIMSIAVVVLITALLVAPWTRSEVLWGVAFFPVIVLGLLAEGIAKTLDNNSGLVAFWRTGMTIGIALLIAGLSQIPLLREIAIQFPELVLTQIVLIIFVAEFLDLRLFQDWDSRLSGVAIPRLFSQEEEQRIAIVRNRRKNGIIGTLGVPSESGYSRRDVRRIASVLRGSGHSVERFEGDMTLLSKLREFIPPHPRTGEPGGLVLNLASGIQGESAEGHVPAMLEMAGVAYAGATPVGHVLAGDRSLRAQVLTAAGVRSPEIRVVRRVGDPIDGLSFPVVVRPRFGASGKLRVVRDGDALDKAIRRVLRKTQREVLVEQYIAGRRIEVALVGNDELEILPLAEANSDGGVLDCPVRLDPAAAERIHEAARSAFVACACRDAARVSLRLTDSGRVYVTEIQSLGGLGEGGLFECAATAAGLSFEGVLDRILAAATERYRPAKGATELSLVSDVASEGGKRGESVLAGS